MGRDTPTGQSLDFQGDSDARRARAAFKVTDLTAALQADGGCKRLQRQAKFFAKVSDFHPPLFAHHEHKRNTPVRNAPADKRSAFSHNANMARKAEGPTDYEALREASGWFAAAWRDYRGLKQQELADEIGTSRGQISDLETGAKTRFNRDWVEKFSKALDVRPGRLIDVNPFKMWEHSGRLDETVAMLSTDDRLAVLDMAERLAGRTGTKG